MYAKYRDFKTFFESERYFEFVDIKCFRDHLVKLRLGLLPLNNSHLAACFPVTLQKAVTTVANLKMKNT